jgi:DNA-binding transcriptional MerR regulator
MAVYSIRELEKLSGIKAHTIRIWEKRYKLIEPHRTNTNIRYYTDANLKKILNVAVLNRQGIKISHIAMLSDQELKEEIKRATGTTSSHQTLVDSLVVAMIDLDQYILESIVDKSISKIGFQETVTGVLYPFLKKVGILWQSGEANPAQEHFVSNLIRQKIIAATNRLPNTFHPDAKKFILMLPEGEWHEIALLFAQYLLKEAHHQVIYLGQSVPYSDVLASGAAMQFDYLVVSFTTNRPGFDSMVCLNDLGGAFPDKKILFFSESPEIHPAGLAKNLIHIHTIQDFTGFISDL